MNTLILVSYWGEVLLLFQVMRCIIFT